MKVKLKKKSKRLVIVSPKLGVFMGVWEGCRDTWTRREKSLASSMHHVPTFKSEKDFLAFFVKNLPKGKIPPFNLVPVTPDRPGNRVSEKACIQAGIRGWTS